MQIRNVNFEQGNMGAAMGSLRSLRDEIADAYSRKHRIAVVEIPTGKSTCGYLILDMDRCTATFTGDGFCTMKGEGEGTKGYKSAEALLMVFGVKRIFWEQTSFDSIMEKIRDMRLSEANKELSSLFQSIEAQVDSEDSSIYKRIAQTNPQYVR